MHEWMDRSFLPLLYCWSPLFFPKAIPECQGILQNGMLCAQGWGTATGGGKSQKLAISRCLLLRQKQSETSSLCFESNERCRSPLKSCMVRDQVTCSTTSSHMDLPWPLRPPWEDHFHNPSAIDIRLLGKIREGRLNCLELPPKTGPPYPLLRCVLEDLQDNPLQAPEWDLNGK